MVHLMLMFPPAAVCHIVALTNTQLACMNGQDELDIGEFLKFLGLTLLITQLEFANCPSSCQTFALADLA